MTQEIKEAQDQVLRQAWKEGALQDEWYNKWIETVYANTDTEVKNLAQPDVSGWCFPKLEATELDMNDPKIKKILEDTQKAIAGAIELANRSIRIGR